MMKLRTISYFLKESVKSLKRNGWMSLASILTVAVSLFICGVFWLLVMNVNFLAYSIESEVEIKAYFHMDTSPEQMEKLQQDISAFAGVSEVTFVSRDEALEILRKQFGEEHDLVAALDGENPLPDSLTIKTHTAEDVIPVAERLNGVSEFEKVRYGQGVVEKLFAVINWVRLLGLGMMMLLALAAVVLIAITIRLTVYARSEEITIMKYVGATDWFIRWPFLLEGMFLGLIGSLVAVGVLFWSYSALLNSVSTTLGFIRLINEAEMVWRINFGLLIMGTMLGAAGSVVSLRKFLKV
ncbi:MAG: ABC transporter permease [Clostridia bacterium]|nr:ABC transporter permease [Clostridia bacterium]